MNFCTARDGVKKINGLCLIVAERQSATANKMLAGTPGLPDRLGGIDASFWSRLGEGLLGVGRLDDTATREALAKPLAAQNVAIEPDALDALVKHSQRYPYFIQLWGDAIWQRHAEAPQGSINAALVAAAAPAWRCASPTTTKAAIASCGPKACLPRPTPSQSSCKREQTPR